MHASQQIRTILHFKILFILVLVLQYFILLFLFLGIRNLRKRRNIRDPLESRKDAKWRRENP